MRVLVESHLNQWRSLVFQADGTPHDMPKTDTKWDQVKLKLARPVFGMSNDDDVANLDSIQDMLDPIDKREIEMSRFARLLSNCHPRYFVRQDDHEERIRPVPFGMYT